MGSCQSNKASNFYNKPTNGQTNKTKTFSSNLIYSGSLKDTQPIKRTSISFKHQQNKTFIKTPQGTVNEKCPSINISHLNSHQLSHFMPKYYEAMRYFYDHDIDNAYQIAQALLKTYSSFLDTIDPQKHSKQVKNINRIVREYKQMQDYQNEIFKSGWILKSNKKGIKISTRQEPDQTVGALMETEIDTPFEIFLSVITEADLHKDYMPFVQTSEQIKILQRNIRVGHSTLKLPFMAQRQTFFVGNGYNRLQTKNCIFICSRSINDRKDLQQEIDYYPQPNPQDIQLIYKYFVVKYEPIDKIRGKVIMATNVDMKVSFIPMFLVDIGASMFGNKIFENILKISKNFEGSQWQKKVKKNPQFYDFIARIIKQHMQNESSTSKNSKPQNL